jgi:chemotaxis protein methyltransferase CheR
MHMTITDQEFGQFRNWLHEVAGISLSDAKKPLVSGRLAKRLSHHGLKSYGDYFRLLMVGAHRAELQIAVDLLTTNETYFFREPKHFDFLRSRILASYRPGKPFRVWSAACSSGQEPYTLAMVLEEAIGEGAWEIVASDLSTRVLEKARAGHYPLEHAKHISQDYLRRFCLKGVGPQAGTFLVDRRLRQRVHFMQVNLNDPLPELGEFDVIFLRNVMIYFNQETKREVVQRVLPTLKRGGHFVIGHSESLNGIVDKLDLVVPSVYRKP